MKTFHQFLESVIDYKMAKPNLGLPKGKAFSKRSSSSAGGNGDGWETADQAMEGMENEFA